MYTRALAIYERHLGPTHPDMASSLNNLALLYNSQGKFSEAEPLYKRALSIYERILGSEHPHTQHIRQGYASLLRNIGCNEEALALEMNSKGHK
ncbi:MAG: tetratricopeptide repeat protein [Chloroflexi bacterium]|nr:MAG: tetratricopeptide repeat protein [Chloroflexota bacterium]